MLAARRAVGKRSRSVIRSPGPQNAHLSQKGLKGPPVGAESATHMFGIKWVASTKHFDRGNDNLDFGANRKHDHDVQPNLPIHRRRIETSPLLLVLLRPLCSYVPFAPPQNTNEATVI